MYKRFYQRLVIRAKASCFPTAILDENQLQKVSKKVSRKVSKKPSQKGTKKGTRKGTKIKVPVFPSKIVEDVFEALKINPKARLSWLADNLGVSERTIKRAVNDLKELGYINSEHSKVKGVWQLLK